MSRLIDADALIDLFTKDKELLQRGLSKDSKFAYMTADYVIKTISEQPTAYNVDKVAEELAEEYKGKKVNSDLISRSEVIKALNEIYLDYPWDSKEDILEKAIGIVEYINCSTDTSTDCSTNNGWIACSVRLPETNTWVLVTRSSGIIDLDIRKPKGWICREDFVIAWMPLPKPYKPTAQPDSTIEAWKQQTMSRFERVE